jgi:signal transduction histidine kinase
MIGKIGIYARNMLESMDDIIWAVNPSNDKFQNLGLRIREYAIPLFESKEINFKILFPEQIALLHLPMEIRRNVYLIAKEAINNLVKYSECTFATIKFKEHSSILIMEIKDNGKGFNTETISNRNGLKNIKRRASQINANLEIVSAEEEGCSVSLHLKII